MGRESEPGRREHLAWEMNRDGRGWGAGCGSRSPTPFSAAAVCGQPAASSGTASDRQANMGQWSRQVSIHQGSFHVGVATLISEQRVLTVASCFRRGLALRQADPSGTQVTETPGPRSERSFILHCLMQHSTRCLGSASQCFPALALSAV